MRLRPTFVAALLIVVAVVRMLSTMRIYSQTVDEGSHIAAGLEVYQFHQYTVQFENPPPARLVMAAAPYLSGMRYRPEQPWPERMSNVFYSHGKYERNVLLARIGNLLFFILAAIGVWLLARDDLGAEGGVLAVLLFTMEPIVMGYSALATHDASSVTGLVLALLAFRRWLRDPTLGGALLFGAAFGFSIVCKYSDIVFVPVACVTMAAIRLLHDRDGRRRFWRALTMMVPAAAVTLLTTWAGFGFAMGPRALLTPFEQGFGQRGRQLLSHIDPATRIPAPAFFTGIAVLVNDGRAGMTSYLCGRSGTTGWWWYFPFAVAMKTTLALLALVVAGAWAARGSLRWTWLEWACASLAMIAVSMSSPLDIGVRYLLPVYATLAIAGATAALAMIRHSRPLRIVAAVLLALQIGASLMAHPDYFPYFNLLAGSEPARYLIDSNLDWGQDILRLRKVTRELKIPSLTVSVLGLFDYPALGFPPVAQASPWKTSHGWVAVSEQSYQLSKIWHGWEWLPPHPYRRVGKSIRLYWVP